MNTGFSAASRDVSSPPVFVSEPGRENHVLAIDQRDGFPLPAYLSLPSPGHPFCDDPYRDAVGVGHNENPSAEVGSADGGGRNSEGTDSVAKLAQAPPHLGQPLALPACDVLDDDDPR